MFNLKVNNVEVDGFISDNMVINALLFDFDDLSTRGNGYSNAIILTKTGLNTTTFSLLGKDVFSIKQDLKIYWKTALILDGHSRVISIGESSFKVQLVGFKKDFADSITEKELMDLDLLDQDFTYNSDSYVALRDSTDELWNWCLIDCRAEFIPDGTLIDNSVGNDSDVYKPMMTYSRPSLNYKYLIDKIITEQDLIPNYSNISDLPVDQLHIGAFAKRFYFSDLHYQGTNIDLSSGDYLIIKDLTLLTDSLNFFNTSNDVTNNWTDFDIVGQKVPSRIGIKITLAEDVAKMFLNSRSGTKEVAGDEELNIFEDHIIYTTDTILSDLIEFENDDDLGEEGFSVFRISFDRDVTIQSIELFGIVTETDFKAREKRDGWDDGFDTQENTWQKSKTDPEIIGGLLWALLYNYNIPSCFNLPDLTQNELFNQFLIIYNLDYDIKNNILSFKKRNILDKANAIVINKTVQEPTPVPFDGVAKFNNFIYTNDESIQLLRFRHIKNYENELLEAESTKVQLIFSGTNDLLQLSHIESREFRVGNVPIYRRTERVELTERIYYLFDNDSLNPNVINVGFFIYPTIPLDKFNYHLDMEFIFDNYYTENFNLQDDLLEYTYSVFINFYEYLQIIANKVIYDSKAGRYLQVLEINKFNPNEKTEIKAIGIK